MIDPPPLPFEDWPRLEPGWVWLCGAGPGDPGQLTQHALTALRQADVIVYDALLDRRILDWRAAGSETVFAGKRGGKPSPLQRDISLRLVELARAGKRVLRRKGGYPFVFGRGGEEAQTLIQHGVPFRSVPGITAGIGGLAYAGIPVTHRDVNQSVAFVTGHDQTGEAPNAVNWEALAQGAQVIVVYMGMKHLDTIAQRLIRGGRAPADPVCIVSSAPTLDARLLATRLGRAPADATEAGLKPPAVICIGRAVLLRQALDWQALARGETPRNLDPLNRGRPAEAS